MVRLRNAAVNKMMPYVFTLLLFIAFCGSAGAVDWAQPPARIFDELRSNPAYHCELTTNVVNGKDDALECKIQGRSRVLVPYEISLIASPDNSVTRIESFSITVQPLNAIPDPKLDEQYLQMADFPYRRRLLRDRFQELGDMLRTCRTGDVKGDRCSYWERDPGLDALSISAEAHPTETFFVVTVFPRKP